MLALYSPKRDLGTRENMCNSARYPHWRNLQMSRLIAPLHEGQNVLSKFPVSRPGSFGCAMMPQSQVQFI